MLLHARTDTSQDSGRSEAHLRVSRRSTRNPAIRNGDEQVTIQVISSCLSKNSED